MKNTILTFIAVIGIVAFSHGQTLDEQFQSMKKSAYSYKEYKNIKQVDLNAFWAVVQDSLKTKQQAINNAQATISAQGSKITSLNGTITEQQATINEKEFDTTHISVLGLDWSKETYKIFNFVVIIGLIVLVGVLFFQFKNSQRVAVAKKKDYSKLSEEYEEYKRTALDKHMKLRRALQTARNRINDLRSA